MTTTAQYCACGSPLERSASRRDEWKCARCLNVYREDPEPPEPNQTFSGGALSFEGVDLLDTSSVTRNHVTRNYVTTRHSGNAGGERNTKRELAEVERLLTRPVDPADLPDLEWDWPPLGPSATAGMRKVYALFQAVYRLRLWNEDLRTIPFAGVWVAPLLSMPSDVAAWRAISRMTLGHKSMWEGCGVIWHAETLPPSSKQKQGLFCYLPVGVLNVTPTPKAVQLPVPVEGWSRGRSVQPGREVVDEHVVGDATVPTVSDPVFGHDAAATGDGADEAGGGSGHAQSVPATPEVLAAIKGME